MTKKGKPPPGRTGGGAGKGGDPPKDHSSSDTAPHEHGQSAKAPGRRSDPFTPDGVRTLLREKVLKGKAPLPRRGDPALVSLSFALRELRGQVQGWKGPWPVQLEDAGRIEEAIWVLTEILPAQRVAYASEPTALEHWGTAEAGAEAHRKTFEAGIAVARARLASKGEEAEIAAFDANVEAARVRNAQREVDADRAAEEARARLAAFDALVKAARAAREVGLPMIHNPTLVMGRITQRWRDFGQLLATIFSSSFPDLSVAAAYRFIAAVTPEITGEHPTVEAVKTEFKKRRFPKPSFMRRAFGEHDPSDPTE